MRGRSKHENMSVHDRDLDTRIASENCRMGDAIFGIFRANMPPRSGLHMRDFKTELSRLFFMSRGSRTTPVAWRGVAVSPPTNPCKYLATPCADVKSLPRIAVAYIPAIPLLYAIMY